MIYNLNATQWIKKKNVFKKNEIRKVFIILYIRCYIRHALKENYVQRMISCHNLIKSLNIFKVYMIKRNAK